MTKRRSTGVSMKAWKAEQVWGFSTCTICKNRWPDMGWKREFTYAELQAATDGFSDENCLSVGGLGPTFRAQLENKLKIIVKQLKNTSQGQKSFDSEVHVLSRARHANVVMLLGSCVEEVTCCSYMSMHAMVLLTNIYQVSKSFFFFFNKVFSKLVWRKVPQTHYVGTQNIIHEHF